MNQYQDILILILYKALDKYWYCLVNHNQYQGILILFIGLESQSCPSLSERPLLPELHEQLWHEPQYQPSCQILSNYRLMGYQSNRLIKERPNFTIYEHYQYTSVQCAISQIFLHGWIIPHFLAFLVFSLQWGHLEKWLIHFWNRLLVRKNCAMCDFPNFSTR